MLKMSEMLVQGQQCNETKGKNESSQVLEGPGHLLMKHAEPLKIREMNDTDHLILYLYLHVWHLSIDSEHAPHDLHRFNLGSNESIRLWIR